MARAGIPSLAPAPPIPAGEGTVWADASSLVAAACSDIQDGELVHGENFSLFAAMSALEIMDPKMDSGMEGSRYCSIEEAIEDGIAPVPLSSDRILDIQMTLDAMDHLFSCEATWHKGHTLAQTVFTCIYLMKIERLSAHPILNSYCMIMRATINAIISVVSEARTHEEEDIFTMSYGLPLKGAGDEKCLSILQAVEETISRQLRASKAEFSKRKMADAKVESRQTNPDLEEGFCRALLCRLRFRKHFYHLLLCMRKPQGRGFHLARKHIASCSSELALMQKSEEFIRSVSRSTSKDNDQVTTTASGYKPVGFDFRLNSRLLSPTPPRAVNILSWKDAISYFEKLLHDLDVICASSLDPTLENVLNFIVQFHKLVPDLVARAHLQVLLVQNELLYGNDFFTDVILRAMALPDITGEMELQSNEFVVQLGQLLINLLKVLTANTSWQRRKLGKILQDWSSIAIQLDLALRREFGDISEIGHNENICLQVSKQLLYFTQEQTYWVASRFLTLGFELELFSPCDYCMVYWYMYVVFMKIIEKMQLQTIMRTEGSQKKGKKKKDRVRNSGKDLIVSSSCLLLRCYVFLSEGLSMMLAALRNENRSFSVPDVFNSEQERFLQHFELLQKAQIPENISYSSYKAAAASAQISDVMRYNFFGETKKIITSLRGSFASDPERLGELRKIEQVADHNRIALNVISQVGACDSSLKVTLDFAYHPHFAVAVVRRS